MPAVPVEHSLVDVATSCRLVEVQLFFLQYFPGVQLPLSSRLCYVIDVVVATRQRNLFKVGVWQRSLPRQPLELLASLDTACISYHRGQPQPHHILTGSRRWGVVQGAQTLPALPNDKLLMQKLMPSYNVLSNIGRQKANGQPLYAVSGIQRTAAEGFLQVWRSAPWPGPSPVGRLTVCFIIPGDWSHSRCVSRNPQDQCRLGASSWRTWPTLASLHIAHFSDSLRAIMPGHHARRAHFK